MIVSVISFGRRTQEVPVSSPSPVRICQIFQSVIFLISLTVISTFFIGPEPSHDKPKKSKLTQPMTPALETRSRHRPVSAVSTAQREEMELAEIKK